MLKVDSPGEVVEHWSYTGYKICLGIYLGQITTMQVLFKLLNEKFVSPIKQIDIII